MPIVSKGNASIAMDLQANGVRIHRGNSGAGAIEH